VPSPRLFSLLKPYLLRVFEAASDWKWEPTAFNQLVEFLVVACHWRRHRASYVRYEEVRTALRKLDDAARAHAVWFLATVVAGEQAWDSFGRHFIKRAWPRESRFRTPAVSRQLAFLAEQSGDRFPHVVQAVGPLLVHTDQLDLMVQSHDDRARAIITRLSVSGGRLGPPRSSHSRRTEAGSVRAWSSLGRNSRRRPEPVISHMMLVTERHGLFANDADLRQIVGAKDHH
jgi:hypothetical protein